MVRSMLAAWLALHPSAAAEPPNLVLISLDTTRADALSCYGIAPGPYRTPTVTTPNIDALAESGIRFERFFAHAPSTLSSHASMLTGLDPHGHAVVRNGFPLETDPPTLAEALSRAGYDTIAVVGSAALDSDMGLDRGFRLYDDALGEPAGHVFQAKADHVVARTLAALDARPNKDSPLFLMAHFYDPHAPYDPPEHIRSRFVDPHYQGKVEPKSPAIFRTFASQVRREEADPADISHVTNLYLGEVAFVDEQIGVLLAALSERGLLEHTVVAVVADHGETLADDSLYAWSHGSNVAWEVMRIPLVVKGYGVPLAERAVIARQAAMSALPSSLLEVLGLPALSPGDLSFSSWLRPGPARDEEGWPERPTIPVYLESTRPRFAERTDAWNNLDMHRGVWAGGYGVVAAPFLSHPYRFYDQSAPPDDAIRSLLAGLVARWDTSAPAHRGGGEAPSNTSALKALGYVE